MKRGFSLIELLAVIVILAIIALIAVPIVIDIINDSKKSSEKESIKLYMDAAEKTITRKQMSDSTFKPEESTIVEKNLKCGEDTLEIEIKGQTPESGIIKIENNKLEGINLKLNGLFYQVKNGEVSDGTKEQVSVGGAICTGGGQSTEIGTKYSCEVKPGKSFNFYVLSKKEDKVSLIMDKNICEDGTTNYTEQNGYCNYSWHADNDTDTLNDTNNYGPDTAMTVLYNATKDWTNVPDMIIDYTDEHNTDSTINGYTSIITDTNTKVTTITGKNGVQNTMIGTSANPLKARMLKLSEAEAVGCGWDESTCPIWLGDNLVYPDSGANYGFWTLSSIPDDGGYVFIITATGELAALHDFTTSGLSRNQSLFYHCYGIRPVITVPVSYLTN